MFCIKLMPVYVAVESLCFILQHFYFQWFGSLHLTNPNNILISFLPVLSPKVIGIAIARYDFCARDMRELSLLKGDVVKIYTKMSANGWWRGEVNGRVRLFFFLFLCFFLPSLTVILLGKKVCSYIVYLNSQGGTCSHLCFIAAEAELLPGSFPSI